HDHIPELAELERARALDPVLEFDAPARDEKARGGGTGVPRARAAGAGIRAAGRAVLARAAALEGEVACPEFLERLPVMLSARALVLDRCVPVQAEGLEGAQHVIAAPANHPGGTQ